MYLHEIVDMPYRPCVGIMLINYDDLIFAGQRLDGNTDAWQMPQGGIDEGETPHTAALRELEEETGISSDLVNLLDESEGKYIYDLPVEMITKLWGGKYRGQEQQWFLFRYLGDDSQININTPNPEFSNWRWMTMKQLEAKIVYFKRTVYRQVFEEFREYF